MGSRKSCYKIWGNCLYRPWFMQIVYCIPFVLNLRLFSQLKRSKDLLENPIGDDKLLWGEAGELFG